MKISDGKMKRSDGRRKGMMGDSDGRQKKMMGRKVVMGDEKE